MSLISESSAWARLADHASVLEGRSLRELFAEDPERWRRLHLEWGDWLIDFSRQRVLPETLNLLVALAREAKLEAQIAAMFRGEKINATEERAVLHVALRTATAGDASIQAEVRAERAKLAAFAGAVRAQRELGAGGKPFKNVINIGIGGSDLGPLLVCDALRHEWRGGPVPHFVSNVDRTQLDDLARALDPAESLIIICSKTFTTQETQANAQAARAWIAGALGDAAVPAHFVAVSTNASAMNAFGIAPGRRFTMWDWVGGRYSVWSAVGLVAELVLGTAQWEQFLAGASEVDAHFSSAPLERNVPVLLGLMGLWNRNFLKLPTLAVLPYDQRLARLPAYLQQLVMESNGKSVTLAGDRVNYSTAPVVWGEPGSNAQHSFFQLLHQGTPVAALDIIAPLAGSWGNREAQDLVLQNCFAQAQAFAFGRTREEIGAQMRAGGASAGQIASLAPHRVHAGNRPSTVMLYPRTTAGALGRMLALYEHVVFAQGVLWGINSFDQFGVELGKQLASGISLRGENATTGAGAAALAGLLQFAMQHR